MLALVVAVTLSVVVSASCSITEAILYSVPWSHIEQLRKSGSPVGKLLFAMRSRIEQPITAVLTLNTIANTAGAAIAGSYAAEVLSPDQMPAFAAGFTVLILVVSEILPKTLGVAYARPLASVIAYPLRFLVILLMPVIWLGGWVTRAIMPASSGPHATEDDIRAIVSLSRQAGGIQPHEEMSIRNILSLDRKHVHDIMTPRTVVFSLPSQMTVAASRGVGRGVWPHSRIPVHAADDPENIIGIVYRREVLEALANDQDDKRLADLAKPVRFVLDTMTLDRVLVKFLESRMHLFVVLDEYGGVSGVITLEDVLEEILGKEIIDETDQVADMRELARTRREALLRQRARDDAMPS